MYKVIALSSFIVRQFYLPNPFECYGNAAVILNLFIEPLIHGVAFILVGTVYDRGSFPALGSLLYLLAYASLTGVLSLMGVYAFAWWWVLIIVASMFGIGVLLKKIGRWIVGEAW